MLASGLTKVSRLFEKLRVASLASYVVQVPARRHRHSGRLDDRAYTCTERSAMRLGQFRATMRTIAGPPSSKRFEDRLTLDASKSLFPRLEAPQSANGVATDKSSVWRSVIGDRKCVHNGRWAEFVRGWRLNAHD